jgi:hypothetical protein
MDGRIMPAGEDKEEFFLRIVINMAERDGVMLVYLRGPVDAAVMS